MEGRMACRANFQLGEGSSSSSSRSRLSKGRKPWQDIVRESQILLMSKQFQFVLSALHDITKHVPPS